ncbi:MAG: glycosyltransferase family 2 protein [Promethearchaeota archaeon]
MEAYLLTDARTASIVIPAYNEAKNIERVLQEMKEKLQNAGEFEIIVVDDGSRDSTAAIAEKNGVYVLQHPLNMGYGAALKSGIRAAKHNHVIFFDGDDSFYPEDIIRLVDYAEEFDMVIGARTNKEGEPKSRSFLRWLFTRFSSFLVGRKFHDVNSGFRLVKKDIITKLLSVLPEKFSITTTMSILLFKEGHSIIEVPVSLKKQRKGNKLKIIRDGLSFPYMALRLSMYYDPFKVFSTPAVYLLALGLLKSIYDFYVMRSLADSSILILLSGIQLLVLALLGDVIVKTKTIQSDR